MGLLLKADREDTIYIAGPMTGYENFNFQAFDSAELELVAACWYVENPTKYGIVEGATWEDYMLSCLGQISKCGSMYMLKGWEKSRGAVIEHDLAQKLGLTIIYQGYE